MRRSAHVSDDRLVEVCLEHVATPTEDAHFASCDACSARRSRLEVMLREITDAAAADSDTVFTDERLDAQRGRILQKIEQDGRPARVIAFPASQGPEVRPLRSRPAGRWIAAAAAAGLAIGLLAGHLAHDLPTSDRPSRTPVLRTAAAPSPQPGIRAVNASMTDEQLLDEIELAIEGPTVAVLRPLNELTPQ